MPNRTCKRPVLSRSRDRQRQTRPGRLLRTAHRVPVVELRGRARAVAAAVLMSAVHEPVPVGHIAPETLHHRPLPELRAQQQRDQQQ